MQACFWVVLKMQLLYTRLFIRHLQQHQIQSPFQQLWAAEPWNNFLMTWCLSSLTWQMRERLRLFRDKMSKFYMCKLFLQSTVQPYGASQSTFRDSWPQFTPAATATVQPRGVRSGQLSLAALHSTMHSITHHRGILYFLGWHKCASLLLFTRFVFFQLRGANCWAPWRCTQNTTSYFHSMTGQNTGKMSGTLREIRIPKHYNDF